MAGTVMKKVIDSLCVAVLLGTLAGCSAPQPPVVEPDPEPAPGITPPPTAEPTPELTVEPAPVDLPAVVAARPHSDQLKAALADISSSARARTNPFSGKAGEEGAADYLQLCAPCHGETGGGGGPASVALGGRATNLLISAEGEALTDGERFVLVEKGIPGTNMQGFRLARSEAQIWKILAHIDGLR